MAKTQPDVQPRTFFLNELHELREEVSGRGVLPKFGSIDWHAQGQKISRSLKAAKSVIDDSRDPIRGSRYFLVANPVTAVEKVSKSKKTGIETDRHEKPRFNKDHPQVFGRLGVDLINVTENGDAIVHATADRLQQLVDRSEKLGTVGIREQARWMTLREFTAIPSELRVDQCWLDEIAPGEIADAIIELQPLLTVVEIDAVMREINKVVQQQKGERLTGTGRDLSGRQWIRARVSKPTLEVLSKQFFSIQSLHRPLVSNPAAREPSRTTSSPKASTHTRPTGLTLKTRPVVAVVDTGVPTDHRYLAPYRRGAISLNRDYTSYQGSHGSRVASRVVFGDFDGSDDTTPEPTSGSCNFLDVHCSHVGWSRRLGHGTELESNIEIDDVAVQDAMSNVLGAYAEARVFNLSIASKKSLHEVGEVEQTEHRLIAQYLDNFAFQHDVLIVVAAGNSYWGRLPDHPYPKHLDDPHWALGRWAIGRLGSIPWLSVRTLPRFRRSRLIRKSDFRAQSQKSDRAWLMPRLRLSARLVVMSIDRPISFFQDLEFGAATNSVAGKITRELRMQHHS